MMYPTFEMSHVDTELTQAQVNEAQGNGIVHIGHYGLGALAELQTVAWLTDIGANPMWNSGLYDRDITVGNIALDVKHTCTHYWPFPEGTVSVKESSLDHQYGSIMVFVWLKKDADKPKLHTSVDTAYLVGWLFPDEVKACGKVEAGQAWRDGTTMKYTSYRVQLKDMRPMEQLATVLVP